MLLGSGGLKPPTDFGENGADFIVGEAQHLAIAPNFGGPGLGIFGCRHNDQNKKDLRSTPGRYIGKAKDFNGRDCFVMVLSTREQHIRKEKATSNVCSNQAFLATLAGASLLAKGENGLSSSILKAKQVRERVENAINKLEGIYPAFKHTCSFNELLLQTDLPSSVLEEKASLANLQIGVNVTGRIAKNDKRNLIKLTFTDVHDEDSVLKLIRFFNKNLTLSSGKKESDYIKPINSNLLRTDPVNLPSFSFDELTQYYEKLADLNVSPDDGCYPLGSCTMK